MQRIWLVFFSVGIAFMSELAPASDLAKAPPKFSYLGKDVVFADFSRVDLEITFDVSKAKAVGHATIEFDVAQAGMPIFDLIPNPIQVSVDGKELRSTEIFLVKDPDRQSVLRIAGVEVQPGAKHTLEISYDISDEVTFSRDSVAAGFFMSDLSDRQYWEQFAPTNYEFDQYAQSMTIEILGTEMAHELFVNGSVTDLGFNKWRIDYADYFTTSSFYFHLVYKDRFMVERSTYQGVAATIPLTVYSSSQSNVSRGMTNLKKYLAELEGTYGAFAHATFTAYITDSGGGMEYCGATVTSLGALGHETTHSWFARGMMPANGNAGWIDEAIASWRDDGYPRGNGAPRTPRILGGFSPYRRFTTMDAYSYGADLMADFDGMLVSTSFGGLKNMLKETFAGFQRQTITVPMFQAQLEQSLGRSMQQFFDKYIYGNNILNRIPGASPKPGYDVDWSRHPRPYTKEEMREIR